jgi:DNA-binding MarR family transcriptional regulator
VSSRTGQRALAVERLERALRSFSEQDGLHAQAVASRMGINPTDLDCVRVLGREGAMTAGALAERTGLTSGAITGVLDRLEKAGLAQRRRDPADRRQVIVEVSPERHPDLDRMLGVLGPVLTEGAGAMPEAQLTQLADLLEAARDRLRAEIAELRGAAAAGELAAPLGDLQRCKLRFVSGVSRLELRGGAPPGSLYRATFEGRPPEVKLKGGQLQVQHARFSLLDWRRSAAAFAISDAIPWEVELSGGTSRMRADLSSVDVRALSFTGGASDVEIELPRPRGVVPVRITGGASSVVLRRPPGVAVQLRLTGGASQLTLDSQHLGAVGGRAVLQTPDLDRAAERYEVDLTGGASHLSIV